MRPRLFYFSAVLSLCSLASHAEPLWSEQGTWHLHLNGISRHFKDPADSNHRWHEAHPGVGLEYRLPHNTSVLGAVQSRWAVGQLRDSRARWGLYASAAALSEPLHFRLAHESFEARAGAGFFAFYRSKSWKPDSALHWVPAVLPVLTLDHPRSGWGASLLAVPPAGRDLVPLVYAQFNYRFR